MIFLILLIALCVILWIGFSVAGLVWGAWTFRRAPTGSFDDDDNRLYGASAIVASVASLLLFGAVATGAIGLGHADGCYYLHTVVVGKSVIQQYDPIQCVGTPVQ